MITKIEPFTYTHQFMHVRSKAFDDFRIRLEVFNQGILIKRHPRHNVLCRAIKDSLFQNFEVLK